MNNKEKFTTGSSELKVLRANSQTIASYFVRFSTDILFPYLVFCFLSSCFLMGVFSDIKNISSDKNLTTQVGKC